MGCWSWLGKETIDEASGGGEVEIMEDSRECADWMDGLRGSILSPERKSHYGRELRK
jgi:hypothetical protein